MSLEPSGLCREISGRILRKYILFIHTLNLQRNGHFSLGVLASFWKENEPEAGALHAITLWVKPGSMKEGQGGKSRESEEEKLA